MTITDLRADERPREKLIACGARSLTDAELLTILVGSGSPGLTAVELMGRVLDYYGGELSRLGAATVEELTGYTADRRKLFPGMGTAKAVTILAACELGRRRQAEQRPERPRISNSRDMYDYWRAEEVHIQPTEHLYVMCLNNAMRVIKHEELSSGSISCTLVDVRRVLRAAILADATQIAICHNHPSGSVRPSTEDNSITARIAEACKTMDIRFLDHLIVSGRGYYSYSDEGRL